MKIRCKVMEESLWRREGGIFGMVVEGALREGVIGDGELGGWFLIRGFGGDCCGAYGLIVLLVEVFSLFFFFSPCEAEN